MFHVVEKYKTPAKIILGLICVSFVFAGGYTIAAPGTDYISKVGDIKININDVNDLQRRYQNASQREISKDMVYGALLEEAYLQQEAKDLGISASIEQIKQIIASDPGFQENGKFDETKYRNFLTQSGLSENVLIENMNKQYAMQSMQNLLQAGNVVSDAQARQIVELLQASRQMQTVTFNSASYADQVKVDGAKLQTYYNANKKNYFLPLGIKFEFVQLSAAEQASKEVVSPEELKAAYEQIPSTASAPKPEFDSIKEQLTQEIQMRKGTTAIAKLKEQLSDLAFKNPNSLQPISEKLGLKINKVDQVWTTKEMAQANNMSQPLIDVLFNTDMLTKKYNSDPIDMGNGNYWVVRVSDIRKEHQGSFQEMKAQIQQDYIVAESQKLAVAAANQAFKAASNGQNSTLTWSATTELNPQQALATMSKEEFQAWMKAKPANGKPAYVLLSNRSDPLLVKIQSISVPKDISTILPQAKQLINKNLTQSLVNNNYLWLQSRYKIKKGAQKLENSDQ